MLRPEIIDFIKSDVTDRFLRYVAINTQSDESVKTIPSTERQRDLGRLLLHELQVLGLKSVELDDHCYVYATIPASAGITGPPLTFCAHMDTSPDESGEGVKPIVHRDYDGGVITFPDNAELTLTPEECPPLTDFIGENIITAAGKTLLGADDKAGVAEIMSAAAAFCQFPELKHPELRIVFTPDEEVGRGTDEINLKKLGKAGYTIDGGVMGEYQDECFDAYSAELKFTGFCVHPGYAKNRMINAANIAARFVAAIPEYDQPEHREGREGFYHLMHLRGDENTAEIKFILRDFDREKNLRRIQLLKDLKATFETRYPGLQIELHTRNQYHNMREILADYPEVTAKAKQAIKMAGIEPAKNVVRGGTDGARLTYKGVPTPNIFTGGLMFHSKKEWIPEIALQKGTEVIIHLAGLWINRD